MTVTELVQTEEKGNGTGFLKRLFLSMWYSLLWGFVSALIIGCFASGIWTVIPTDLLTWGSSNANLIGYISHCTYAPISTLILLTSSGVGIVFAFKINHRGHIGPVVFGSTLIFTLAGLNIGFDIVMFIAMGTGVGVGIVLATILSLIRRIGE